MPGDRGNRYRQMAGMVLSRSLLQRAIARSTRVSGNGRTGTFLIKEGGYWESISRIDPAVTRMEEFGYFFSAHDGAGDRRRKRLHIDGVLRKTEYVVAPEMVQFLRVETAFCRDAARCDCGCDNSSYI